MRRHSIPLITSIGVKYPWLFTLVGFGVVYCLRGMLDYARSFHFLLAAVVVAGVGAIVLQPAIDVFYGAKVVSQAREKGLPGFAIPSPSLFFSTMVSELGTRRRCAGYAYAAAQTCLFFAAGVLGGIVIAGGPFAA